MTAETSIVIPLRLCIISFHSLCNNVGSFFSVFNIQSKIMNVSGNSNFVNDSEVESRNTTKGSEDNFSVIFGLLGTVYFVFFVLAFVGNILALMTCYKNYRVTTSIILIYIASLASADLLFTVLTVFDLIAFALGEWLGGAPFCKIQGFFIETSYSASILTLVAISYERFRSITSRSLARSKRIETRMIIIKLVWVVSVVLCSPVLYGYVTTSDEKSGKSVCVNNLSWGDKGRQIYYSLQAVFLFLLPLGFMMWAHFSIFRLLQSHSKDNITSTVSKKQRKVTKMLAVVTLIFFCCWSPFIIVRAVRYFNAYDGDIIWRLSQLLIFLNSGINPILYCFFSGQFRSSFKEFIKCNCKQSFGERIQEPSFGSNTFHATQEPKSSLSRSTSPLSTLKRFQNLSQKRLRLS